MTKKKKPSPRRVAVDINRLDVNLEEMREILGVPEDVWARMPDSEKILVFTQRGIDASRAALQGQEDG